ncbi:ABC transporter ATP-binding protein [Clostridium manihotivorum]|uniref:Peptide ABC transporter ATP-binding protein n=1 Tax=Clostridium manihotivorum TaxID=2320868 RepID=A0A410E198_9CLOT|nr:ABC transporter ATP-binding protein [Clostridium manihotivorum]QAA35109.1 peptide ABC transporter ATP-binding protein [Clostridium manihotivorum]
MEYVLEAENICKSIGSGEERIDILKNINLYIKENEYVAIMGPSGSGKSTLLSIISCIDKQSSGKVRINGVNIRTLSRNELTEFRNENIGIVFQAFNLIPVLNAEENIETPLFFSKKKIDVKAKVDELIAVVGLEHRRKSFPKQLSGGEQQRIAIARALAGEPKILFADEPTGALDSKSSGLVLDIFDEFRKKYNMAIVVITHDIKVAKRADRIVHIIDGQIYEGELLE